RRHTRCLSDWSSDVCSSDLTMKTTHLTLLLQIAALLHLGLICAGASMPKAVRLSANLATLPAFIRRLFLVYFVFIGLVLVGFGRSEERRVGMECGWWWWVEC